MPRATPQLLASTTPGWMLVVYSPSTNGASPAANSVVLVSPSGELYDVVDLPTDRSVRVDRWTAGTTVADMTVAGDVWAPPTWARLDLTTGELVGPSWLGSQDWFTTDGRRIDFASGGTVSQLSFDGSSRTLLTLVPDSYHKLLNPSGERILVSGDRLPGSSPQGGSASYWVGDFTNPGVTYRDYGVAGAVCVPYGWLDDSSFLAVCADPAATDFRRLGADLHPAVYRITADGTQPPLLLRRLVAGDSFPTQPGVPASGGLWLTGAVLPETASRFNDHSYGDYGVWFWSAAPAEPTRLAFDAKRCPVPWDVLGGTVYLGSYAGPCSDDPPPARLDAVAGGRETRLFPDDVGANSGATSWVLGK